MGLKSSHLTTSGGKPRTASQEIIYTSPSVAECQTWIQGKLCTLPGSDCYKPQGFPHFKCWDFGQPPHFSDLSKGQIQFSLLICPWWTLGRRGISRVCGTAFSSVKETVFIHNRRQALDAELSFQQSVEVHNTTWWCWLSLTIQWPVLLLQVHQRSLVLPQTVGFSPNPAVVSLH